MKKEDLIKKLENIDLPEIELQSHRRRLRMALLNSGYFKKKTIMKTIKHFALIGAPAIAVVLALIFTVINPKLQEVRAIEIAKNDPQIRKLMEENGVVIKEVKVKGDKAYVLLALSEAKLPSVLKGEEIDLLRKKGTFGIVTSENGELQIFTGAVAEISLGPKRVAHIKIKRLEAKNIPITPLTEEEKSKAIEIAKSEQKIKEIIPNIEKAEVIVKPMPPLKLRLEEDNDEIKVISDPKEDKRANVIFKFDGGQNIITVNLTQNKVETAMSTFAKIESSDAAPPSEFPAFILTPSGGERGGVSISINGKNLDELLKDARLISDKDGVKIYEFPRGEILEITEKDRMIVEVKIKVKTE